MKKDNPLKDKSYAFASRIVNMHKIYNIELRFNSRFN